MRIHARAVAAVGRAGGLDYGVVTFPFRLLKRAGVLFGLYACREANTETLLEYTPDYAIERAGHLIDHCAKLGVALPADELLDRMPEWAGLLHRHARQKHLR